MKEIDWEDEYKNLIKIDRNLSFTLSYKNEMRCVIKWIQRYPEAVKNLQNAMENDNKRIRCPFPVECSKFPCENMCCNADVLDNGHAYRMS